VIINKIDKNLLVQYSAEYDEIEDYIVFLINVYSALFLYKKVWLTDREVSFFTAIVINYIKGVRTHLGDKSDETYIEVFGSHNKKERSIYLGKLKKKNWVKLKDKKIEIPEFFQNIENVESYTKFGIKAGFSKQEEDDDRFDTPEIDGDQS